MHECTTTPIVPMLVNYRSLQTDNENLSKSPKSRKATTPSGISGPFRTPTPVDPAEEEGADDLPAEER